MTVWPKIASQAAYLLHRHWHVPADLQDGKWCHTCTDLVGSTYAWGHAFRCAEHHYDDPLILEVLESLPAYLQLSHPDGDELLGVTQPVMALLCMVIRVDTCSQEAAAGRTNWNVDGQSCAPHSTPRWHQPPCCLLLFQTDGKPTSHVVRPEMTDMPPVNSLLQTELALHKRRRQAGQV